MVNSKKSINKNFFESLFYKESLEFSKLGPYYVINCIISPAVSYGAINLLLNLIHYLDVWVFGFNLSRVVKNYITSNVFIWAQSWDILLLLALIVTLPLLYRSLSNFVFLIDKFSILAILTKEELIGLKADCLSYKYHVESGGKVSSTVIQDYKIKYYSITATIGVINEFIFNKTHIKWYFFFFILYFLVGLGVTLFFFTPIITIQNNGTLFWELVVSLRFIIYWLFFFIALFLYYSIFRINWDLQITVLRVKSATAEVFDYLENFPKVR